MASDRPKLGTSATSLRTALILLALLGYHCGTGDSPAENTEEEADETAEPTQTDSDTDAPAETSDNTDDNTSGFTYPDIGSFETEPSDQFLVDIDVVVDGHMFRGERSNKPHQGGHVYFDPTAFVQTGEGLDPTDFPPVYAVADGIVGKVDYYFAQSTGNFRYGLLLNIATKDGESLNLNYSIEPFLDPGDENFYRQFLLVENGEQVSKGQIVAYVYSSNDAVSAECEDGNCTPSSTNAHIHFDLNSGGEKMAPSIFSTEIVDALHLRMSSSPASTRNHDSLSGNAPDSVYSACIDSGGLAFKLSENENPFEAVAADCL